MCTPIKPPMVHNSESRLVGYHFKRLNLTFLSAKCVSRNLCESLMISRNLCMLSMS
ncbi:hypothetical protein HanIR_Chr14g0727931 [Helianthus annuus]|nr:hypothetical protein HanIR_Chr14g0727931 [Helianthus annuus]